jgi:predicted acylesterase/phospholipase RssA/CRP-like cAMP-binding protein
MNSSALARLPFLHGAPAQTIAAVKRVLKPVSVTAGTVLFRTGDEGDSCYFVDSGALSVTTALGGEVLATLGPGSFVGELALLLGEPRSATVTANTDAKLSALLRGDLERLMRDHPSISLGISRELGRRIVTTNQRFAGDRSAHRAIVWPATMVAPIAEGLRAYDRRVGVGAFAGAVLPGPAKGVNRVKAPHYGSDTTAYDSVLLGVGTNGSSRAASVVRAADHVLCFTEPPEWLADAAPPNRLVRLADSPEGIRRAVRWASGRAVGLALSSGGSKAVAHMGVIRVLRDAGVEIDAVAGSSGGAIAALFVGFDQDEPGGLRWIADIARFTTPRRLDLNLPPRSGLSKGRRLRDAFARWDTGRNIEDAAVPMWLLASDVATGGAVALHHGSVADAVRASLSIPGAFDPWRIDGKVLMDGGIANPLPTDVLRDAGVGIVLASNVAGQATAIDVTGRLPGLGAITNRMLNTMERERIRSLLPLADVVIRPRVSAAKSFDFSNVGGLVEAGAAAGEERIGDVRALLAAASGPDMTRGQ